MTTLGFIGYGKMAEALWQGARHTANSQAHYVYEINDSRNSIAHTQGLSSVELPAIFQSASIVFLCIKPQNFNALPIAIAPATPPIIVSIMAGISLSTLAQKFPGFPLARVMPNTPAMVGEAMSAISFSNTSGTQENLVHTIFKTCGDVVTVPESWMDMVTGISGSGPAFLYRLCLSAVQAAQTQGIPESTAIQLFAQTLIGAGKMLQKTGKSPQQLISDVTSPGGTTLAGLSEFDQQGIESRFSKVMMQAAHRSQELSSGAL